MTPLLDDKLASLPTRPGVYKHKDADGTVLYVGKAKNLRSRVRSYFHDSRPREGRLRVLVSKIADVEVIVTDTEAEALILENNLIKQLQPRYNVNLKDDKTYPYICIKNERFPRVFPTRRVKKDGSTYFGPYTDVKNMKRVLKVIRSIFKLRTCNLNLAPEPIAAGKYDTCLEYHIQKCAAPCVGYQSEEAYDRTIKQVEKLLNGHTRELVDLLEDEMERLAEDMQYEEAATIRDQIHAIKKYSERQKIVSGDFVDRDLFALVADREAKVAAGVLFKMREGKIIGRQHKYLRPIADRTDAELLQSFLEYYYTETTFFPDEVLLSIPTENPEPLEELLRRERGKKVPLKVPKRGEKKDLMQMVAANAKLLVGEWKLQQMKRGEERIPYAVKKLQEDLHLDALPRRIECFDISHLGGTGTVASCVVFADGKPRKRDYRTYKIRSLEAGEVDDYQAMREVITRRYRRTLEENGPWPDLVVIDGGKGQLSSAVEALRATDVYGRFPVIGLAKRLEEVFVPGDSLPRHIARDSASLKLLQRVRDEAHRFAVSFQRKQRSKTTLQSELTQIDGIGPKTAQKLLKAFGSVKRVRSASTEALEETIGPATAAKVRTYFDETGATPKSAD
ncbi:MAG: excinuclease ABC subunit C [Bacteroidetes bacterium]|jgi:excinuclease ABC subunit C|nr:excinuclease ABC subunit C [Bacteroidota bacterium]